MQKCKIGLHEFSVVLAGRNLFVVQRLLTDSISIPWVKDEHIWNSGGIIIDREMTKE
jgi:hypothetical protein